MSEHPNPQLVAISLGYVQRWLEARELEKAVAQTTPSSVKQRELEKAGTPPTGADAGARSAEGPAWGVRIG